MIDNKFKVTSTWLLDLFILISLSFTYILGDLNSLDLGKFFILFGILSIIQLMYRHRQSDILNVFLFFSLSYLLYMTGYYFFNIPYHYLLEYQKVDYTNNVLILQVLFIRLMFFGLRPNDFGLQRLVLDKPNDSPVFYIVIAILLVMVPISIIIAPPTLGVNYTGEIQSSIWLEYCLIFIIIGGVYVNSTVKKNILIIVSLIYVVLPMLYGRRLQTIMILLSIFVLFYRDRVKVKYVLIGAIGLFVFMRVYASIRVGVDMTIMESLLSVDENGVMGNNQGGVFVCASTYWGLIQEGVFDMTFRIKSFIGVFTSIFLPASLNLDETYINFEALKHAPIPGNGGFPSIYLFIWGGYFGVFFGALIFNRILRNKNNSRKIFIYTLFIFSTFPRWHSYNMFILIKMGFWLLVFTSLADLLNNRAKPLILK